LDDAPSPPAGTDPDENGLVNVPEELRVYSSVWNNDGPGTGHARSMLDSAYGWVPQNIDLQPGNDWMQMDLGRDRYVSGIVTQGRGDGNPNNQWTSLYKVQHSIDGVIFEELPDLFSGNNDQTTKVYNSLEHSVLARHIRLLPYNGTDHVLMRAAVVIEDVQDCRTCVRPSTVGYGFNRVSETLHESLQDGPFAATGITCSSGYTGTPSATVCSVDAGEYTVSGCKLIREALAAASSLGSDDMLAVIDDVLTSLNTSGSTGVHSAAESVAAPSAANIAPSWMDQ
jgi:hypothetical protein